MFRVACCVVTEADMIGATDILNNSSDRRRVCEARLIGDRVVRTDSAYRFVSTARQLLLLLPPACLLAADPATASVVVRQVAFPVFRTIMYDFGACASFSSYFTFVD